MRRYIDAVTDFLTFETLAESTVMPRPPHGKRAFTTDRLPSPRPVDWRACPLVEQVPGKVSGVPLLKGTRMPVQTILDNLDYGMSADEVAATWELDPATVRTIYEYAEKQRARSIR